MAPVDPPDTRLLEEIPFASDVRDVEARKLVVARVLGILKAAGAETGQDVIDLGCTGLGGVEAGINDAIFVRENMAGAGFGLTCYVGPDRYCLVHETIGGLQTDKRQEPRHVGYLAQVSRELTEAERQHVGIVESARRVKAREGINKRETAREILNEGPQGLPLEGADELAEEMRRHGSTHGSFIPDEPFTCPEHDKLLWRCRFCVAAEIVKGELIPSFLFAPATEGNSVEADNFSTIEPNDIESRVAEMDGKGLDAAAVFVKVAVWRRKLARD
jgi:hypothetical protein